MLGDPTVFLRFLHVVLIKFEFISDFRDVAKECKKKKKSYVLKPEISLRLAVSIRTFAFPSLPHTLLFSQLFKSL